MAALKQESEATAPRTPSALAEPVALVVHQDVSALKEAEYLKDEFIEGAGSTFFLTLPVL